MKFTRATTSHFRDITEALRIEGLCFDDIDLKKDTYYVAANEHIQMLYGFELFGSDALLRSVWIAQERRGKGFGHDLMSSILNQAKDLEISSLYLLTTTAAPYFERGGFSKINRTDVPESIENTNEFKNYCPDTAVCMKYDM
ncbi:unnamed protein product [marine sediment metagenome]|uniref:N-acetyltransferase domain-containing protein n=1 Tax=marine sediment metagenome TaxID=412755 RepID=X1F5W0_9ZZZZ